MANGPGEIILLCRTDSGGLVSEFPLKTWDDMDAALEERGKGAADVRTSIPAK